MLDEAIIRLRVSEWSQTIVHGAEWGPFIFRVSARTSDDEEIVYGADGYKRLRNMPFNLGVVRGPPEKLPERGIGIFGYYPARPPRDDIDGTDEAVGGWFWLPEDLYDEVSRQSRERHDECVIELEFTPVETAGPTSRWNTVKNKVVSITRAEVRFERKPDRSASDETEGEEKPPKVQVDLPARIYSLLTFLIVISAALLILTFMRH
jgi:hypothetical protein